MNPIINRGGRQWLAAVTAIISALLLGAPARDAAACGTVDLAYRAAASAVGSTDTEGLSRALHLLGNCNVYHTMCPARATRRSWRYCGTLSPASRRSP